MLSSVHFLLLYILFSSSQLGPSQSCVRGLLLVSSLALADDHKNDDRNDRDKDRKIWNLHGEKYEIFNPELWEVADAGDQDRRLSRYLNSVAEDLGVAELCENIDHPDESSEIAMKRQKAYTKHSSVLLQLEKISWAVSTTHKLYGRKGDTGKKDYNFEPYEGQEADNIDDYEEVPDDFEYNEMGSVDMDGAFGVDGWFRSFSDDENKDGHWNENGQWVECEWEGYDVDEAFGEDPYRL